MSQHDISSSAGEENPASILPTTERLKNRRTSVKKPWHLLPKRPFPAVLDSVFSEAFGPYAQTGKYFRIGEHSPVTPAKHG
ncbi:MAG: hypothetical protein JW925_07700 [Syntrophaceae bacterium]|nr:hypothetical protein [Syntrophaceae bacterium]